MIRKSIRLRKEYVYKKEKEIQDSQIADKKQRLKKAIDSQEGVPNELKRDSERLMKELEHDDNNTIIARTHMDDEYEEAKYRDPQVLITTCRSPSMRLLQF